MNVNNLTTPGNLEIDHADDAPVSGGDVEARTVSWHDGIPVELKPTAVSAAAGTVHEVATKQGNLDTGTPMKRLLLQQRIYEKLRLEPNMRSELDRDGRPRSEQQRQRPV